LLGSAVAADERGLLDDLDATLVLYETQTDRWTRINAERAATPFSPCSTFKIPNSLIGLETGVIAGPDIPVAYDAVRHPRHPRTSDQRYRVLARPHTLRTAIANSVVWYYQELAEQVGAERMADYLRRFDYGNQDISGGIDRFWLESSLRISADEQIEFLRAFYQGQLASARSTGIVKEILLQERGDGTTLYAKTGMGLGHDGRPLGWWVGWVERAGGVTFFAYNVQAADWDTLQANRVPRCRATLAALGVIAGD